VSESTDLTVIDIKPEQAPALYIPNGLDAYLEHIKESVNEAPDLSTKKGRDRVASLAAQVSRSKTAIEKPGREYLKRLKEAVKPAEQEIKRFVDACDVLRDETRRPLTEWEAEQERIAAEKAAEDERLRIEAEELAAREVLKKQFESDHEIALLLNEKFDRDAAEAKADAERKRIAYEEELKRHAAERARVEAEQKAKAELEASARREAEAQVAKERAEREAKEAAELADRQRIEAQQKAERDKQEAIATEQRKAQEAADKVRREAEAKETARLAEERRIADEAAKRAADVEHRKTVNNKALSDLIAAGVPEDCAKKCITAIAKGEVSAIRITY
jgi:hypothetical protein